jgi:uncharacterized membrane protein
LGAFAYTFVVVAAMWVAHHRVFAFVRGYDTALIWLNLLFLAAIVLLPFPSSWVGEVGFDHGIGVFYLLTLTVASGALTLMTLHVRRHPSLLEPWARVDGVRPLSLRRSLIFTGFFLVCAGLAVPWPDATSYLMLLLIPLSILDRRLGQPRPSAADA